MKPLLLLLAVFVIILSSCSTAYKSGQTPDDVYYSPTRPDDDYNRTEEKKDDSYSRSDDQYYDDRYLRMKVHNRTRWSELDDWYYYGNRYNYTSYNCNCLCENPWTPYSYWNNHYNPYYNNYVIISPKTSTTYNKPRSFNLNAYNTQMITNRSYTTPKSTTTNNTYTSPRNVNTSNRSTDNNSGNFLRDLFKTSSSSNSNSNSTNSSSNSNSSNSNSSSNNSSKSTSAPVRRF